MEGNYYGYLELYRNNLFEQFIAKYDIPRTAFPDLDKPTRPIIPSLLKDSSDGEETDAGSEDDEEQRS